MRLHSLTLAVSMLIIGLVLPALAPSRAGAATPLFKQPVGVAVDSSGNIWVLDGTLDRVMKLSPKGKLLTSWGKKGGGRGEINDPTAIALGRGGSVWVADQGDTPVIEEFSPGGKLLAVRDGAGDMQGLSGRIAFDSHGNLWIAAGGGVQDIPDVIGLSPSGKLKIEWKLPHKSSTTKEGIAVDRRGNVYIGDEISSTVYRYTTKGKLLGKVASHGSSSGQVDTPEGLAVDSKNDLFVAEQGGGRTQEFSPAGKTLRTFGDTFSTNEPQAVAVARNGTVYVADNGGVHVYSRTGKEKAYWH